MSEVRFDIKLTIDGKERLVSASDGTLHADVKNPCFDFFFHIFLVF